MKWRNSERVGVMDTVPPDREQIPTRLASRPAGQPTLLNAELIPARAKWHRASAAMPAGSLSLRANFSWTFVGNLVYAGCQWGIVVMLAKLGSAEVVGQFALGLAVTAPVLLFTNLQLRGVQATDAKREYRFGDYLGLRLVATVLALLAIAGIVLASGYPGETGAIVLIVGLAKAFESISDVFYGLLQQHERMDRIAISMMLKGLLSLIAVGIGLILTGNLFWALSGMAAAWAVTLLVYDIRSGANILRASVHCRETLLSSETSGAADLLRPRWNVRTMYRLAWLAFPLGVVMLLISLSTNIPRYFIEHNLEARDLGIFAALSYPVVAGTLVVNALGQSVSPRLAHQYAAHDRAAFRALLLKLIAVGVGLGAIGITIAAIVGRQVLTLIYRPEYAEHIDVFLWLMAAAGIGYASAFLGYAMTAARYFRIQILLIAASTGTTLVACALLVPRYQLLGAAVAITIAAVVQLVGYIAIILFIIYRKDSEEKI